jgi:hypothetical protein
MVGKTSCVLVVSAIVASCSPATDAPHSSTAVNGLPTAGANTATTARAGAGVPTTVNGAAGSFIGAPTQPIAPPTLGTAGQPAATPPLAGGPTAPAAGASAPTSWNGPAVGTAPAAPGTATCPASGPCSHGTEPVIPMPMGACPNIVTGPFAFMGNTSQLWVGAKSADKKGPIVIYFHGTGGTAATATGELDPTCVSEVMAQGGVIASITEGIKGDTLDWGVFTTGDYQTVDQVVACAVAQLNIDTKQIYTSGASAGGLAAGELVYLRSSYMAVAFPNSGGEGGYPNLMVLQDPTHVPAAFTMHGAKGVDMVVIDFGDSSLREDVDLAKRGGFAVDCNHGGGHVAAPADLKAAAWDFAKKHPFGYGTSPFAGGLPATYPKYCMIVTKDTPPPMPTMTGAGAMAPGK